MSKTAFAPAVKTASRLRLALIGPAGSGKTYTALAVASELGDRVAVLDTEHGSASKYADLWSFDAVNLDPPYEPERYVALIDDAASAGYDVLIIDSLSHAWTGSGGVLEIVDDVAAKSRGGGGNFAAWREATPRHRSLIEAIVAAPIHIIATMRSKVRYAMDKDEHGKTAVVALGVEAVQREGTEYEFDVVGMFSQDVTLNVIKSRCPALAGRQFPQPGVEFVDVLREWLAGAPDDMGDTADALCLAFRDAADEDAFRDARKAARVAREEGNLRGSYLQRVVRAQEDARTRLGIAKAGSGNGQADKHSDPAVVKRLMGAAKDIEASLDPEALAAWVKEVEAALDAGDLREGGTAIDALSARRNELQALIDGPSGDDLGDEASPSDMGG